MTGSDYMLASNEAGSNTGRTLSANAPGETAPGTTASEPMNVYLYAGDQIIENVTMGYFYYQDSLGNTSHVTDAAGNLLERYTYSAFGIPTFLPPNSNTARSTSAFGIRHLFQGQLWTQETGLNDYRNRVDLPVMGVFLQPDPLGLQIEGGKLTPEQRAFYWAGQAPEAFSSSEMNLYRYCHNDPVNKSDPFGLEPLAKGLIDIPEKALKRTYDNGKDAANQSLRNNDRRSQTERRTDTFSDNGKVRNTETTTGYKWPSPQAPPPKLPPGVPESARLTQAHDHVGSPAKHYGGDKASANDVASGGRFPLGSGVSSTSDRGVTQEFYIPSANQADRAANRGGAFFITNDGIHFTPAPYHP